MNATGKEQRRKWGMNRHRLHRTAHTPKRTGKIFRVNHREGRR